MDIVSAKELARLVVDKGNLNQPIHVSMQNPINVMFDSPVSFKIELLREVDDVAQFHDIWGHVEDEYVVIREKTKYIPPSSSFEIVTQMNKIEGKFRDILSELEGLDGYHRMIYLLRAMDKDGLPVDNVQQKNINRFIALVLSSISSGGKSLDYKLNALGKSLSKLPDSHSKFSDLYKSVDDTATSEYLGGIEKVSKFVLGKKYRGINLTIEKRGKGHALGGVLLRLLSVLSRIACISQGTKSKCSKKDIVSFSSIIDDELSKYFHEISKHVPIDFGIFSLDYKRNPSVGEIITTPSRMYLSEGLALDNTIETSHHKGSIEVSLKLPRKGLRGVHFVVKLLGVQISISNKEKNGGLVVSYVFVAPQASIVLDYGDDVLETSFSTLSSRYSLVKKYIPVI